MTTLYGKDSKGNLKIWEVTTSGAEVTVTHGRLGGKMASTTTTSEPKNIGKSNETTAEEQAIVEAQAKVIKQLKRGYYMTKEDALGHVERTPMKAQDYKDQKHKVKYPCVMQPKLNGLRILISSDLKAQSKAGEEYKIPEHILEDLDIMVEYGLMPEEGLDGEIYAGLVSSGGLSLQQINSAFKKENENTHKLNFCFYDTPSDKVWIDRMKDIGSIESRMDNCEGGIPFMLSIDSVPNHWIASEEEADMLFEYYVGLGYEGVMYRNLDGLYEYGKRSYDMIKRKPRHTMEVKVVEMKIDKIGQGVLTGMMENGKLVEFLMRKDADENINYRLHENALTLVDKFVEIEFEELSDAGIPTKPVGIQIRSVNEKTWEAME